MARPARIELAAPRLGVLTKEATRGSGTPLPRNFIDVPANARPPETTLSRYRLSAICQPSSSLRKALCRLSPRFPVSGSATCVRHGHDQDASSFNSIDDAERKAPKQVPASPVIERRPGLREPNDRRFGSIDFAAECCSRSDAALCVPARGCFCLLERFLEVFKLAGHGRPQRGCDAAPRTMESSWRCPRRLDRAVREFRQPTRLQRRRLLRLRDFESARQQVRLALRQRGEELRPGAAWHPYRNTSTSRISRHRVIVLLGGEFQDCRDVVGFEIRIVRQDLVPRGAGSEEIEYVLHADAEATNARTAAAHIGTHRD